MNFQFILMIIGDFLVIVMMGFYAGVGIWESGTVQHILGMIVPSLIVWGVMAVIFKIYVGLPESIGSVHWKELSPFIDKLIKLQKPGSTFFVWAVTCVFQTLWISFYWRGILHSQSYFYRFSISTAVWYVSSYAIFFIFWRAIWTFFNILIALARSYKWLRITGLVLQCLILLYTVVIVVINVHYQSRKYKIDTLPADAPRTALRQCALRQQGCRPRGRLHHLHGPLAGGPHPPPRHRRSMSSSRTSPSSRSSRCKTSSPCWMLRSEATGHAANSSTVWTSSVNSLSTTMACSP